MGARLRAGAGIAMALRRRFERFAFAPARAEPLAALRIGLALVLLGQAALIAPMYRLFYDDRAGLRLPGPLREALGKPDLFHGAGVTRWLGAMGVGASSILAAVGVGYVLSLVALLLGLGTRVAAALACSLHLLLESAGEGGNYGADWFAQVFLFYLVWLPSGAALSLGACLARTRPGPSSGARLGLRVVQIHLAILYLTNGLAKARYAAWWNGEAIWQALMSPAYSPFDFSWLARHPWIAVAAGWGVLLVELGYAWLIWPRSTRRAWVLATVGLHLGIAVLMRLVVFGAMMIVFTVAAFGVSAELPAGRRARSRA